MISKHLYNFISTIYITILKYILTFCMFFLILYNNDKIKNKYHRIIK